MIARPRRVVRVGREGAARRPERRLDAVGAIGSLAGIVAALLLVVGSSVLPAQDLVPLDPLRPEAPPAETAPGDRSHELLDYRCASTLGRRQVTLFANGTVRLWDGLRADPRMTLGELGPDELGAFLRRLRAEDLSEVEPSRLGAQGDWVERCTLELAFPGEPRRLYGFSRYDALPLGLAAVLRVADELAGTALPLDQLPLHYEPRPGDLLRRTDGVLFEVVRRTADGKGLELRGKDQPLTLYVRPEDLRAEFDALLSRRP